MGAFLKLIDVLLFLIFLILAILSPLIDFQLIFPHTLFPDFLIDLKTSYTRQYGDYLMAESPPFLVGLVWLELFFQWPIMLLNLYAFLASKPWYNTTCLIYGVSVVSSMVISVPPLTNLVPPFDLLFHWINLFLPEYRVSVNCIPALLLFVKLCSWYKEWHFFVVCISL